MDWPRQGVRAALPSQGLRGVYARWELQLLGGCGLETALARPGVHAAWKPGVPPVVEGGCEKQGASGREWGAEVRAGMQTDRACWVLRLVDGSGP